MAGGARRRAAPILLVLVAVLAGGGPARAQTVIRGGVAERPSGTPSPLARALAEADRHPDRRAVVAAIRRAGRASGLGDGYLLTTAALESGFRPDARSARSTALGPFQFLEDTWLDMMGADAARTSNGRVVPAGDEARRQALLDLRRDPEMAAVAALRFTGANRRRLKDAFGREPATVDLYLAHLLGAGGAVRFLTLLDRRPDATAQPWFPEAARANPGLFLGPGGRARSLRAIRDRLNAYFDAPAESDGAARRGTARVVRVTRR